MCQQLHDWHWYHDMLSKLASSCPNFIWNHLTWSFLLMLTMLSWGHFFDKMLFKETRHGMRLSEWMTRIKRQCQSTTILSRFVFRNVRFCCNPPVTPKSGSVGIPRCTKKHFFLLVYVLWDPPASHFLPLKPALHLHLKSPSSYKAVQVPPFSQGFSEQGLLEKEAKEILNPGV